MIAISAKSYHAIQLWVKSTKLCGHKVIFDILLQVLQDLLIEYFTWQIVMPITNCFKVILHNKYVKKIFCHSVQSSDEYAGQVGFRCMFNILHAQIRQTKAAKSMPQFLNFLLC